MSRWISGTPTAGTYVTQTALASALASKANASDVATALASKVGSSTITTVATLTQAAYDALATKDAATLYVITP